MTTLEILDRLQGDALKDGELRKKLLATRLEKDPLTVFCRLCRSLGYELYEMDLVSAGEDFYCHHAPAVPTAEGRILRSWKGKMISTSC